MWSDKCLKGAACARSPPPTAHNGQLRIIAHIRRLRTQPQAQTLMRRQHQGHRKRKTLPLPSANSTSQCRPGCAS